MATSPHASTVPAQTAFMMRLRQSRLWLPASAGRSMPLFLLLNPGIHLLLENLERHRTLPEHDIVELSNVESGAEPSLGVTAQLADLELSDLVAERLSRPHDI